MVIKLVQLGPNLSPSPALSVVFDPKSASTQGSKKKATMEVSLPCDANFNDAVDCLQVTCNYLATSGVKNTSSKRYIQGYVIFG